MAVWQVESGGCTDRGFSALHPNGILAKFYSYITKAPGAGGPQWTILLDKSALPSSQVFTVDFNTDIFTCAGHGYYTGDIIQVSNSGGALPSGLSAATDYFVAKINANTFYLCTSRTDAWERAGGSATQINIGNNGTGTQSALEEGPYIVVSDQAAPTANQACFVLKVGYKVTEAALIRIQSWLSFDTVNKVLYGLWSGYRADTIDGGAFAYDFRAGEKGYIIQTRIGTSWKTAGNVKWTGDVNLVEPVTATGTLAAPIVAGSNVNITVGGGEGANFTIDKYYYIYDFVGHAWVDYVKCTNVVGDVVTVNLITAPHNYPAGAVMASYAHRQLAFGNSVVVGIDNDFSYAGGYTACSKIPYCSAAPGYEFHSQNGKIWGNIVYSYEEKYLTKMSPNDEALYANQRPGITENNRENDFATTSMNRGYGIPDDCYITLKGGMAAGLDGRTISKKDYLYFEDLSQVSYGGNVTMAFMILDTES